MNEDAHRVLDLLEQIRLERIEHGRPLLEAAVTAILVVGVVSVPLDSPGTAAYE